MLRPNFFILSGPPGAGKTSVLNEIGAFHVQVDEPARRILSEQRALGGTATGEQNAREFVGRMADMAYRDYSSGLLQGNSIRVFDRGLPDLLGFSEYYRLPPSRLRFLAQRLRYNRDVFWLPSWKEIYHQDAERRLDFEASYRFGELIKGAYLNLGYRLNVVPSASPKQRALYVRRAVAAKLHRLHRDYADVE